MQLDLPGTPPPLPIPLDKVGTDARAAELTIGHKAYGCSVAFSTTLPGNRKGIHLSRFGEVLHEAEGRAFPSFQSAALWLAREARQRQETTQAAVVIKSRLFIDETTPITKKHTKKCYTLAVRCTVAGTDYPIRTRVSIPIIVACPCVQVNLEHRLYQEVVRRNISETAYTQLKEVLPMPSHSQRATVTVSLEGASLIVDPLTIIEAVQDSVTMTYDLLKRADEVEVVYQAHSNPQFCEDVTRNVLWAAYKRYKAAVPPETVLGVKTVSEESIHSYNISSAASMTFAQLSHLGDDLMAA